MNTNVAICTNMYTIKYRNLLYRIHKLYIYMQPLSSKILPVEANNPEIIQLFILYVKINYIICFSDHIISNTYTLPSFSCVTYLPSDS